MLFCFQQMIDHARESIEAPGHGFKHGPEVGRMMAGLVVFERAADVRFSLATKETAHDRTVL